jgi:hypothetical protein
MSFHRNAKLGLAGRYALVCAIDQGLSLKGAGKDELAHSVSSRARCNSEPRMIAAG